MQFDHKFALISDSGDCSSLIKGVMREDGSAAILSPECRSKIKRASRLRYFCNDDGIQEYNIKKYYPDKRCSSGMWLHRPIVVTLFSPIAN